MAIGASFQQPPRNACAAGLDCAAFWRSRSSSFLLQDRQAQQSTPAKAPPGRLRRPHPPFLEAETLLRQGSIDEAKAENKEQLKLNPSSVEGYNLLGIAYSSEKDYDHALEAFQHALTLDPNSARTHNNLGNVYVAQQKFDLAEKEFGKVLRADPANREANYNLGLVLMARGSPAEAIPHFQRVARQISPLASTSYAPTCRPDGPPKV